MYRKRNFAALTDLCSVQRLHIAAARVDLADALDQLAASANAIAASRKIADEIESDLNRVLASPSLDPDAMWRAGTAIVSAEAELIENVERGRQAELAELAARQEWHSQRIRSRTLDDRRDGLHRKLMQLTEDKVVTEVMALSASQGGEP